MRAHRSSRRHPWKESVCACVYMWCRGERHHLFHVTVMKWGALWDKTSEPFITAVGGPSIFCQSSRDTSTKQTHILPFCCSLIACACACVTCWAVVLRSTYQPQVLISWWTIIWILTEKSFACYLPHLTRRPTSFAWYPIAERRSRKFVGISESTVTTVDLERHVNHSD